MKYKTVIFDMDGTLLDTIEDIADSVNYAMEVQGRARYSTEEVKGFVGNGAKWIIEQALGTDKDEALTAKTLADYKAFYAEHGNKTCPYPGIYALLKALKERGVGLAVVSNKHHSLVPSTTRKYFDDLFDIAIGESADVRRKPHPDSVLKAIDVLNGSKESAVYIGDSDVDILTAKNVGIPCISVTWGYRNEDFLRANGGSIFAHSVEELQKYLLEE